MHHTTAYRLRVSFLAVVTLLMTGAVARAQSARVFDPDSEPFGTPFRQWTAQWWQHVLSFPLDGNPLFDETGALCMLGQRGPVWLLYGSTGGTVTRTCSVPSGKALLFPVINQVDFNTTNQTARELRAEVAPCMDAVTTLSVEVDGRPVRDLDAEFRVRSAVFEVTIPPNSFVPPGTYSPAIDDGFWVMLKPLSVGSHTVHIRAARDGCPVDPFALDVLYHLTIVPVTLK